MRRRPDDEYWNHNSAYHPMILKAAGGRDRVLDIGCGDGLLAQRLAPVVGSVLGIDSDRRALTVARQRCGELSNIELQQADFSTMELPPMSFDLITCVATLHHLPLGPTLRKMRTLLRPGGRLIVIGLSATSSPTDEILSGLAVPLIRVMGRLHRESGPDVVMAEAGETLAEIRETAGSVFPGARIRRLLYYRYLLDWTSP